jgi:hypothetical protein
MSKTLASIVKKKVQEQIKLDPTLQKKLICDEVLETLGKVKDLHQINAVNVYYNKWRVDVWIKEWENKEDTSGPSYHVKHSYFCTVQDNCISGSIPEIIPEYK